MFTLKRKTFAKAANRFKKFDLSTAFKISNTLANILHTNIGRNDFNPVTYRINCSECNMIYIAQTVNLIKTYKTHISAFKSKNDADQMETKMPLTVTIVGVKVSCN